MSHSGLKRRLERALGKLEGPRHRRSKIEYEAVYDDAPACLGYGLAQRALPFSFGCRSLRWRRRRSLRIRSQSLAILGPRTRCRLNQRAPTSIRHRTTTDGAPSGTSRRLARRSISGCLFRTSARRTFGHCGQGTGTLAAPACRRSPSCWRARSAVACPSRSANNSARQLFAEAVKHRPILAALRRALRRSYSRTYDVNRS